MWQALAGLALNVGKKNKARAEQNRVSFESIADEQDAIRRQNAMQRESAKQNLDIQQLNQKQQGATNPILDDIMKKYGAGRYSR